MSAELDIDKARSIYQATKGLQLDAIPSMDLKDRLSLATVAAGQRPVGVLEGQGLQLERVRDVLVSHGLQTLITNGVWDKPTVPEQHRYRNHFLTQAKYSQQSESRVLWVCGNREQRNQLKITSRTKGQAGALLGYPPCCVEDNLRGDAECNEAFVKALVDKFGDDEKAIEKAMRDDAGVEISAPDMSNVPDTEKQFPFVIHIACRPCLDSNNSPSAILNAQYEKLAQELDVDFHRAILEMADLFRRDLHGNELFREMDAIHNRLYVRR